MNKATAILASFSTALLLTACFSKQVPTPEPTPEPEAPATFSVSSTALTKTAAQTYTHTFTSNRAGTVSYENGCTLVGSNEVVAGSNSKTINTTSSEFYQNCSFTVSDETNNDFDELSVAYIKLDSVSGEPLADQALSQVWGDNGVKWGCVEDLNTGLIWEVKETDGGLRDKDWYYTWYDPNPATNGGDAGISGGGTCYVGGGDCDTSGYANDVNALATQLCGSPADWRVPSQEELKSLLNASYTGSGGNFINLYLFPNNRANLYWSSSPFANNNSLAWEVFFYYGDEDYYYKGYSNYVRLVRGGQ